MINPHLIRMKAVDRGTPGWERGSNPVSETIRGGPWELLHQKAQANPAKGRGTEEKANGTAPTSPEESKVDAENTLCIPVGLR